MRLDYHHLSRLWDLLITATMAFVAIEVPEHFVLEYNITAHPVVYWLVTFVLCVDVFVQWYRIAPQLVRPAESRPRWAIAPDIGWLIVDLVAVIPFRVLPGGATAQDQGVAAGESGDGARASDAVDPRTRAGRIRRHRRCGAASRAGRDRGCLQTRGWF